MDSLPVRKIGGSLYIRLPFTFRHKFGLKAGDRYEPIPNADGSIIKLIKADELEKPTVPNGAVGQGASVAAE
jgi:hypothetical protein